MSPVDTLSRSSQDYVKAIYNLTREGEPTNTVALAEILEVKPASVTNMLQKLDESEPRLVNYQKHHGVSLTKEGERAALQLIRRHRLIEQFLHQVLGYSWDKVHPEAEVLEHAISPYFEEKVAEYLGDPQFDPHGDPIPSQSLSMAKEGPLALLSELEPGEQAVVHRVRDQSSDLLLYLGEIGLLPGRQVRVLQRNPFDGAMQVAIEEKTEHPILSRMTSQQVLVEMQHKNMDDNGEN